MALYEYEGLDSRGKEIHGIIDADSPSSAKRKLKKDGIYTITITQGEEKDKAKKELFTLERLTRRIKREDVVVLTRQMATLTSAGLPVVESLEALIEQTENARLKRVLRGVKEKVNEGLSLAQSLAEYPKVFPTLYINMIKAGEQSGTLELTLKRLSNYLEKQLWLKNRIMAALAYPMVMTLVGIFVLSFLITYVIPKVSRIFEQIHQELPLPTKILITISDLFKNNIILIIILSIITIFIIKKGISTDKGELVYHKFILRLPIFGKLFRMVASSRFAGTLSTLLGSGIPMLKAMDIVTDVVGNRIMADAIKKAKESIREGESIAEPLRRSNQYPALLTHMIAIGEKTGELESMLNKISEAYENEIEAKITAMLSILEPVIIVIMGIIIGFIVLSILLPIFEMNQLPT
ncbi:MAG: type II secretion system protein GspF [Spirochaetes bacterium]|nr:MAG: type II secretion system protein GspF [Spirochaetota bacterium]